MKQLLELDQYKRSAELYLRALWGTSFPVSVNRTDDDNHTVISYLHGRQIFLPARVEMPAGQRHYYRAAATHAAAHSIYGGEAYGIADYNLMQRTVIGLVEDLRIELQAIKAFPGLRKLWLDYHDIDNTRQVSAQQLLVRLSRSVLDEHYHDAHQWVQKGRSMICDQHAASLPAISSVEIGLALANDLGQMRLPLNSGRYQQAIAYRDDNRCLWVQVREQHQHAQSISQQQNMSEYKALLREALSGMNMKTAEQLSAGGEGFSIEQQDEADFEYRHYDPEKYPAMHCYPEWDYRTQVMKQDWCQLLEYDCDTGSQAVIDAISQQHKHILSRLRHIASRLRIEKQQRVRKQEEGDEVDLDPMINAMVSTRSGQMPDPRVFMRHDLQQDKSLAISILLDLSESTNKQVNESQAPLYQLLRDAVLLLGETLSIAGEAFAIAGFSSNGRQQVNFNNFKRFDESFDSRKACLSGIRGSYSTRLGTAIRHCAQQLAIQPQRKKLLLVITDGAPSDIDVYDPQYLVRDSWHAVHNLHPLGIKPFCLNLDSEGDATMEQVFGQGRFMTLDNLVYLPEVLSYIYIRYMRH